MAATSEAMTIGPASARSGGEWRRGWPVVLASAAGVALSTTHIYSIGVLIGPIETEFGWSRAQISAGMMVASLLTMVISPFVGGLVDRIGPRRVALVGATAYCASLALLSLAGPSIGSWIALWVLLAIGLNGITPTIWTFAVSGLFARARGLALAVTLCGTGIGSSLTPIVTSRLSAAYGWRGAYVGLALIWAVVVLPLLFLLFSSARDRHRIARTVAPAAAAPVGFSVRAGFRSPRFWKLAVAACAIALVVVSFAVNLVPILVSTGLTRERAAEVAGIAGIASIVGRLSGGVLLDRGNANLVAAGSVLLPIVSSALLLGLPGSLGAAIVATALLGFALGAELDAVAYLATRHLGMRSYGVLFGTISGLLSLCTGTGPLIVNHVFDVTRSYTPALWGYMPLCLLAALLFATLGRYPDDTAFIPSDLEGPSEEPIP